MLPFGLISTIGLAAMAVLQARAILPAGCDRNITVTDGDTCDSVSAQYNVSTYQLAVVNAGIIDVDCTNLYAGENICLGLAGQDCKTTYAVGTDDTCLGIASKFNITLNTLFTNNPNINPICTNLYPNEVLCVSSMIYVNVTASSSS